MKLLLNLLKSGLLALIPFLLHSHLGVGAGGGLSVALPPISALFDGNTIAFLGTALYWLELIVRVIPTTSAFTPLTLIIQLLQAVVPNQAVTSDGVPGVHVPTSFFRRLFHHQQADLTEAEPTLPISAPAVSPDLVQAVLAHFATAGVLPALVPAPNVALA